ncbi:MAG: UPF0280 family protein [Candidatus Helarchaeota archaeon]|nr:UPF0280 family protein [Candidatus Helarchaeota archaeon]
MPLTQHREIIKESDIFFKTDKAKAIRAAILIIKYHRNQLEQYIAGHPKFLKTLQPIRIEKDAPEIISIMAEAGEIAGVGPMAAVAGALADLGVKEMVKFGAKVALIENGGEIAGISNISINVGIFAGNSPLSGKIGFRFETEDFPIGLGTSSGTVGHAFSFGEADAATVLTNNAALGDAGATAVANEVKGPDFEKSVQKGLEAAETLDGVRGALIIRGKFAGIVGKLPQLLKITGKSWKVLTQRYSNVLPSDFTIL